MAIAPTIQTSDFFEKSEVFWAKAIAENNISAIARPSILIVQISYIFRKIIGLS